MFAARGAGSAADPAAAVTESSGQPASGVSEAARQGQGEREALQDAVSISASSSTRDGELNY